MDARPISPQGWHFVASHRAQNGIDPVINLSRIDHPVRYVIIDYDCSTRFEPGKAYLVNDFGGRDRDPPELAVDPPYYDAFKLDVFTVGNVFKKDFHQVRTSHNFGEDLAIEPLVCRNTKGWTFWTP